MRRTALAVLALACVLLVGGCVSLRGPTDPGPTTGSTAELSRGDRPGPAPVRTNDLPLSPANATEFARQWVNAVNQATTTNDTDQLRVLSASACRFCRAIDQAAHVRAARGSRVQGAQLSITSIRSDLLVCGAGWCSTEVEVQAYEQAGEHVMADGTAVPVVADPNLDLRLQIHVVDGRWWVTDVDVDNGNSAQPELEISE